MLNKPDDQRYIHFYLPIHYIFPGWMIFYFRWRRNQAGGSKETACVPLPQITSHFAPWQICSIKRLMHEGYSYTNIHHCI